MFAALTAHCEPGDEVICIEPYFDQYFASIHFQGAKPVFVPLHPPTGEGIKHGGDWTLNMDEFAAAFTPKTKAVIINTPHNPVGKVFTKEELEQIAKVCIEKNVLVLADEVYDCMVYDGKKHFRIATLPGMWERTLTVGSGGKSFACTGWRVGESIHFHFLFFFFFLGQMLTRYRMAHRSSPTHCRYPRRAQPNRFLHQLSYARSGCYRSRKSCRAQVL